MKASDWTVVAMLANMAVICLAHPEGGGGGGSGIGNDTGVDDSHILPNETERIDRDIETSSNAELSTVRGIGQDSNFGSSQGGGGHASGGMLSDGFIAPSEVGEYSERQGGGVPLSGYSALENGGVHGGLENEIDGSFEVSSSSGIYPDGHVGLSGEYSSPAGGGLHGGENGGTVSGGGFDVGFTTPEVGGSHAGEAGDNDGSVSDAVSGDYDGRGDIHGGYAEGRGSAATATIHFNLGALVHRGGGYNGANGVSVGAHGGGGGDGSGYDGSGFISGGSNGGVVGGEFNKQGNVDRIVQGHNGNGGVDVGGEYGPGSGDGFGGVNVAGHGVVGYSEPDSEHNGGGYDDGVGAHIEGEYSGGGGGAAAAAAAAGAGGGGGYNNQGNVGKIVHGHNGHDGVRSSEAVGGDGVNIGGEYGGGSSGEFGGVNVDGVGDFGYSEYESEHNGEDYDRGVSGYIEGVHSDGGGGEGSGGYHPTERNGALVGGGVGGIYLTSTSNDGAYSVPAVDGGGVPQSSYNDQAVREGGISAGSYSGPEVIGGNVSGDLYSPPAMGGGSGSGGGYSSASSDGGNMGHQSGSTVQSGILEAEFLAPDNSFGYGGAGLGGGRN